MDNLKNIFDLSKTSVIFAAIIFLITMYVSKYLIDSHNSSDSSDSPDSEKEGYDWKIYIYSMLIGITCSFSYLAIFKYITKDNCDILTDPFCSKLNIV